MIFSSTFNRGWLSRLRPEQVARIADSLVLSVMHRRCHICPSNELSQAGACAEQSLFGIHWQCSEPLPVRQLLRHELKTLELEQPSPEDCTLCAAILSRNHSVSGLSLANVWLEPRAVDEIGRVILKRTKDRQHATLRYSCLIHFTAWSSFVCDAEDGAALCAWIRSVWETNCL